MGCWRRSSLQRSRLHAARLHRRACERRATRCIRAQGTVPATWARVDNISSEEARLHRFRRDGTGKWLREAHGVRLDVRISLSRRSDRVERLAEYVLNGETDDGNSWYANGGVAGHAG